jgi:HK97 family phage prohead protease
MHFYGSFSKVDAEQRIVEGYASTEAIDAHGEIVLKAAIEDALAAYMEFGNVREMHQLSAVGTAEEASVDDKGLYLAAKIVDDDAWGKVTSGVYKGFSIGGKTLARDPDNRKIITKLALHEISLVDRPSNPEARFDVWKAAGADTFAHVASAITKIDGASAILEKIEADYADMSRRLDALERA